MRELLLRGMVTQGSGWGIEVCVCVRDFFFFLSFFFFFLLLLLLQFGGRKLSCWFGPVQLAVVLGGGTMKSVAVAV